MSKLRRNILVSQIEDKNILPIEYKQVTLIGSTYGNHQEINIDYIPDILNEEYCITAKNPFLINDVGNGTAYFFGCGYAGSYIHVGVFEGANMGYYMRIRNSSGGNHTIGNETPTSQNNNNILIFIASYDGFFIKDYITDNLIAQYTGSWSKWNGSTCPYSLKIFTCSSQKHELWAIMELYGFQIKDKITKDLRVNLIPCIRKSDNKPGVYDTVRNRFFINSGTKNDFYYQL